jgi:hypothetical protein
VQTVAGRLLVRERRSGLLRELELTSNADGRVERVYKVGGVACALDGDGQRG